MRRRARLATVEREQKDERTSRKSTKTKGDHYEPNPDERSLTRGAASQKTLQAAFRLVAASIREPRSDPFSVGRTSPCARSARKVLQADIHLACISFEQVGEPWCESARPGEPIQELHKRPGLGT
jgi:hypothetical protein